MGTRRSRLRVRLTAGFFTQQCVHSWTLGSLHKAECYSRSVRPSDGAFYFGHSSTSDSLPHSQVHKSNTCGTRRLRLLLEIAGSRLFHKGLHLSQSNNLPCNWCLQEMQVKTTSIALARPEQA